MTEMPPVLFVKVSEGWWHFGNFGGFCAGDRGFESW